jgi:hypothetical protein
MEEQINAIRDFINNPRRQYRLLKNEPLWFQLCSSLDVIGDTQLAIDSYGAGEFGGSHGARYLAVYGLLQALFVQQHAVRDLCESLGIPQTIGNYPKLKDIAEIRNDSVGHPTKRDRRRPTSYHFMVRMTLRPEGFDLHSRYADGRFESTRVRTPDLIADQRRYVDAILDAVVRQLEDEDAAHKERFKMEKLAELFPPTLGYYFEKISAAAAGDDSPAMGAAGLQGVRAALQAFEEALLRRDLALDTYDCIKHTYKHPYGGLEYPLAQLEGFFATLESGQQPSIDQQAAYIFAWFVKGKVDDLRGMAQEIDTDYSS